MSNNGENMLKKIMLFFLFILLIFCMNTAYASTDTTLPKIVINGTEITDYSGIVLKNDTLFVLPHKVADHFDIVLSCDENKIVYTFSGTMRIVTYDSKSGSVNVSDKRSFRYKVTENAYVSYSDDFGVYIPLRMLCNSFDISVDYLSHSNTVEINTKPYSAGLYTSDGVAIAKQGSKYGIVDSSGRVVLPVKYDDISNYDNQSLFEITDNHKCGLASADGTLLTEIAFNNIEYVSAGEIYLYQNDNKGMCNIDGRILVPVIYDDIAYSGNHIAMVKNGFCWYLYNCSDETLSDMFYDEVYEITTGIQTVNNMIKGYYALKNGKWGCVDSFGTTVIPFKYEALDKFDEMGRARVIYNGKFGIIDCGGTVVIPPAYDYIYPFGTLKVAVAQVGNKYGAVNLSGNVAIPFEYDYIYSFNNSKTTVAYKDNVFSVINTQGEVVTDKNYKYIEEFKNGLALAYANGYGYIDHNGNEIIECIYSDVKQGTALSVFLKNDEKWALFSSEGENLTGFIYEDAGEFENGLSSVSIMVDGVKNYGYVNDSGDVVIPFSYSTAQKFKYGKAIVSIGSKYGIIDVEGKVVIPFEYTGFNTSYEHNVIAAANDVSKWGLISFSNKEITPFVYDYIFEFENGYAVVLENHKYGIIDTEGNIVVDVVHDNQEQAKNYINANKNQLVR